jgi:hypothetical protein
MYFVTVKRPGYIMFCMTPSERFAVGLTEQRIVHLLERVDRDWRLLREWPSTSYSHTDFMAGFRERDEPANAGDLIALLPTDFRH